MFSGNAAQNAQPPQSLTVLLHTLRAQKLANGRGATLLLGAGCSLSSTHRDITTAGLIRQAVAEVEGFTAFKDDTATALYRRFVNYWHSLGSEQSTQLLQRYLSGLQPSSSHAKLRGLVEGGYISTLITTNFDLLLDRTFEGLSYCLVNGANEPQEVGPGAPGFLLIKVHGDLSRGGLRFSPHELNTLPDRLAEIIAEETYWPTLVIGYRGQDIGLMSCLNRTGDYNAFWATPTYPDPADHYTNEPVFQWMSCRRSGSNFIYGEQFGRFETLIDQLHGELAETDPITGLDPPQVLEGTPWAQADLLGKHSSTDDAQLFLRLLLFTKEAAGAKGRWTPAPPHFARSYEALLEAHLQILAADLLPEPLENLLRQPQLLFVVLLALELLCRSAGLTQHSASTLLAEWVYELEKSGRLGHSEDRVLSEVNALVTEVARLRANPRSCLPDPALKRRDHIEGAEIVLLLDALAACFPTTGPSELFAGEALNLKFALQRSIVDMSRTAGVVLVMLRSLQREYVIPVLELFFGALPEARVDEQGLTSRWLTVRLSSAPGTHLMTEVGPGFNLFAFLEQESARSLRKFIDRPSPFAITGEYVEVGAGRDLRRFMEGDSPACLVVGPSGSGKTTVLQAAARRWLEAPNRMVLARSASEIGESSSLGEIFFGSMSTSSTSSFEAFLSDLIDLLNARGYELLLILDAINEAPGNLEAKTLLFREINALASSLREIDHRSRIRVVASVREMTFQQFYAEGVRPSVENFFCPRITSGDARPYLDLEAVEVTDQAALVRAYFSTEAAPLFLHLLSSNSLLAHDFRHPYLIAIAGHCLRSQQDVLSLGSSADVFAEYAGQMIRRIGSDHEQAQATSVVFAYLRSLLGTTGDNLRVVTKMALLLGFAAEERRRASESLLALQDVNLLTIGDETSGGVVVFSHDRLGEYFIAELLLAGYDEEGLVRRTLKLSQREPVARGGLTLFLLRSLSYRSSSLTAEQRDRILGPIFTSFRDHELAPHLTEAVARALVIADQPESVLLLLGESLVELPGQPKDYLVALANGLAQGLSALLVRYRLPRVSAISRLVISFLRGKVADSDLLGLHAVLADAEIRAGRFTEALDVLASLQKQLQSLQREDAAFVDRIALLRSVALKEMGLKAEAIEYLHGVYQNQKQIGHWARTAETGLELGTALRDDTRFDQALELYRELDEQRNLFTATTKIRLALQIGTVYKNLVQMRFAEPSAVVGASGVEVPPPLPKEIFEYNEAGRYLGIAIRLAKREDAPVLLAEALADSAELDIVASRGAPELLESARIQLRRLEEVLARFPIAARVVELCRLRAKIASREGRVGEAVGWIGQARGAAAACDDSFRVADCDYQLGGLVLANIRSYPTEEFFERGARALEMAEEYYVTNVSFDNIYLSRVRARRQELLTIARELGLA